MLQIDNTHAQGMATDIPLRLFMLCEIPHIRAPWFVIPMKKDKAIQDLFLEQLDRHNIPYVLINKSVWFFWTKQWCSYDYYLDEDFNEIKINLLVYRISISKPTKQE